MKERSRVGGWRAALPGVFVLALGFLAQGCTDESPQPGSVVTAPTIGSHPAAIQARGPVRWRVQGGATRTDTSAGDGSAPHLSRATANDIVVDSDCGLLLPPDASAGDDASDAAPTSDAAQVDSGSPDAADADAGVPADDGSLTGDDATGAGDGSGLPDATVTNSPAVFLYPRDTSFDVDLARPFEWTAMAGADAYYLYVGSAPWQRDLIDTGEMQSTAYAVPWLPTGQTLYATIWTKWGGTWYPKSTTSNTGQQVEFTARATSPALATFVSPRNNAVFDPTQSITWTAVPGAQAYRLYLGSQPGQLDLADSGDIQDTSYSTGALGAGQTVYATIWTYVAGNWGRTSISFTVQSAPITSALLTYPVDGQSNVDLGQPFRWVGVANAATYYLYIGSQPGQADLVNTGELQGTSYYVPPLPLGQKLYATIWTQSAVGGWSSSQSSFIVQARPNPSISFIYPQDGQFNVSASVPFSWMSVSGADSYYLYVGTQPGKNDVVDTGAIPSTTYSASNLPTGVSLYASVWIHTNQSWVNLPGISFQAVGDTSVATLVYPTQGAQNVDLSHPLQWSTVPGADAYYLYVGSQPVTKDLVDSGEVNSTTFWVSPAGDQACSHRAACIPVSQTVYVTLYTKINGRWKSTQTSFSASPASPSFAGRRAQAQALTAAVREMADAKNVPKSGTALQQLVGSQATVDCTDYTTTLQELAWAMRLPIQGTEIAFNNNNTESHAIAQLWDSDQNAWTVLDPTFGIAPRRTSDGGWATTADIQTATQNMQWGAVNYEYLSSMSPVVLHGYYLDYQLLYNNISYQNGAVIGAPAPVLPYLTSAAMPVNTGNGSYDVYVLAGSCQGSASVSVDGAPFDALLNGVSGTSSAFFASIVSPDAQTTNDVRVLSLNRYVF